MSLGSIPFIGTVYVAQLVRVLGCDSRGRGFNSHHTPKEHVLYAPVMELVVMLDLKSSASIGVRVRLPSGVQMPL